MKRLPILLFFLICTPFQISAQTDTKLDNNLAELEFIGEGSVYYLGIFKVYDAKLYVQNEVEDQDVLSGKTSKCLVLEYNLSISAKDIIKGANIVLSRQHDSQTLEEQKQFIEAIHQNYTDVSEGDSYALCYDAASSKTTLFFNGSPVAEIDSREFASLYFGIWLGEKEPISESLRKNLLKQLTDNS